MAFHNGLCGYGVHSPGQHPDFVGCPLSIEGEGGGRHMPKDTGKYRILEIHQVNVIHITEIVILNGNTRNYRRL